MIFAFLKKFLVSILFFIFYFLFSGQEMQVQYTAILALFTIFTQLAFKLAMGGKGNIDYYYIFETSTLVATLGLSAYFNSLIHYAFYPIIIYCFTVILLFTADKFNRFGSLMVDRYIASIIIQKTQQTGIEDFLDKNEMLDSGVVTPSVRKATNGFLTQKYLALALVYIAILPFAIHKPNIWVLLAFIIAPIFRWYLTVSSVSRIFTYLVNSRKN